MRLLDLFCGEGGAGEGYRRAGFDITGVDNKASRAKRYPGRAVVGDALGYLLRHGHEYDAIHASPPCTGYSQGTVALPDRYERYDRYIPVVREALVETGKPYVIENVEGAKSELRSPVLLCGQMFGLKATDTDGTPLILDRHRLFETSFPLRARFHYTHRRRYQVAGAYDGARRDKNEARHERKGGYSPGTLSVLHELLDTPWMTKQGCWLSIPPAYTEYIGGALMRHLEN